MTFLEKLNRRIETAHSLLCVGLDSDVERLPKRFLKADLPQFAFNKSIIDVTHEFACAYKINFAFYAGRGRSGFVDLGQTMRYLRREYPDIFVIADTKRGDVANSNEGYVVSFFDNFGFDAATVHPYMGRESLLPFLRRKDKGVIVLCRTSNPGAREFQDLKVDGVPLWEYVAKRVAGDWNENGNCMLVVGATYPNELARVREIVGEMTILVPGVGAQGGSVEAVVKAGLNREKRGLLINSSRGIIFAKKPDVAAQQLRDEINHYRVES